MSQKIDGTLQAAQTLRAVGPASRPGISTDAPARLAKFTERDQLNFTLLSDEDHKVADAFGVWGEKKFMGKTYMGTLRTTFIIDENGVIEKIITKPDSKNHGQEIVGAPKKK